MLLNLWDICYTQSIRPAILRIANSAIFGLEIDIILVCAECSGGVLRAPTRGQ